ncbi:unnamed protein product [Rotaria magnacalcarata]|uniref:AB hydrolase-1 domain-containing protein n=1 Tax=Rotaria magnacalcarata TaxID=392030 RepID=A0A816YMT7_9BILA|nr:unnamed protein product [Rotaria magnacalcarata]CAF2167208.1 unnamed protein product [Rotaria magnacalcarata]CAF4058398.1 unnamed protein product [Rotaria magnacalcarata]CAF4125198.1 unnamed protein product [Rotaria magnacalcarata]
MTEQSPNRRWPKFRTIFTKISLGIVGFYILVSLILPIILIVHPTSIGHIVFLNFLKPGINFTQPEKFGLDRVFNFYLNVEPTVRVGVWHYRSPLVADQSYTTDQDYFQKYLVSQSSAIPIVIYLHGNAFDRSLFNRRGICEKLRKELKYDVFTFDYRGYGDSTGEPTEEGLITDARYVYDWIHNITNGQRKIYIWGQSLGSAVACQLAARLSDDESKTLAGLVMEAPFINLHQALQTHYLALLFRWQPWYYGLTEKALHKSKLAFQTRGHLSNINCPCVLLHSDDDYTIPYAHSKQLLQAGLSVRDHNKKEKKLFHFTIDMISFHSNGYGHSLIYRSPKLIPALKHIIFDEDL